METGSVRAALAGGICRVAVTAAVRVCLLLLVLFVIVQAAVRSALERVYAGTATVPANVPIATVEGLL